LKQCLAALRGLGLTLHGVGIARLPKPMPQKAMLCAFAGLHRCSPMPISWAHPPGIWWPHSIVPQLSN